MLADAALDWLEIRQRCRHPIRAVLLIGSLAEGYANASSDIDLVGIVPEPARGRLRMREHGFELGGRAASISYVTERMLRRRLAGLDKLYQAGGHLTDGLATRIANARVLYDPEGVAAEIVSLARTYRPSSETLREMMRICLGFLHDALGSRAAGDHATAVLMARAAASVAIDCYLLDRAERNLKPKWHLRRLQSLGAEHVLDPYVRVLGLDGVDQNVSGCVIDDAQQLLCAVLQVSDLRKYGESPLLQPASGEEGSPR